MNEVKIWMKCDDGRLSKIIEYGKNNKVEIPINNDGSVKWFDDSKLVRKSMPDRGVQA